MSRFFAVFYRCKLNNLPRFGTAYATTDDGSYVALSTVIKFLTEKDGVTEVAPTNIVEFKSHQDFLDCQR